MKRLSLLLSSVLLVGGFLSAPAQAEDLRCGSVYKGGTKKNWAKYTVHKNLHCTGSTAIFITGPYVILNGRGHSVTGSGDEGVGLRIGSPQNPVKHVLVHNLTVNKFGTVGARVENCFRCTFDNVTFAHNGVGLYVANSLVPRVIASATEQNTSHGMVFTNTLQAEVRDSTSIQNDGHGVLFNNSTQSVVDGSLIRWNHDDLTYASFSHLNHVKDSTVGLLTYKTGARDNTHCFHSGQVEEIAGAGLTNTPLCR